MGLACIALPYKQLPSVTRAHIGDVAVANRYHTGGYWQFCPYSRHVLKGHTVGLIIPKYIFVEQDTNGDTLMQISRYKILCPQLVSRVLLLHVVAFAARRHYRTVMPCG
ncbi:hypothetical protein AcV7_005745 [Taiwanofungus camphoratus]|nr:hypothetical protein AcV7_005745 [Antrodia cinnamomea]